MIKYFCDICGKEVQREDYLVPIKIIIDSPCNVIYYSACYSCRISLNEHIRKIKEKLKNGNT